MKTIAIIPARGGSKGIKKKNITELCRKPLISYTILEAIKSKKLNEVFISTDDNEIAEVSKKFGGKLLWRPRELAQDDTPTFDVVFYILKQLEDKYDKSTIIVLLQPTSPLRTAKDIDNAISLYNNNDCDSVISVCKAKQPPQWSLKIQKGSLLPLFNEKFFSKRRQDLEFAYLPNGAIYIASSETLSKYRTFYCKKTIPYMMPPERSIDIDDKMDLILAEFFIKQYEKN